MIASKLTLIGLAGALALSAITSANAAPVLSSTATVKSSIGNNVTDVRWRGGAGIAAGAIAGVAVGAAIANSNAYNYGGYPAYGYGYPAYGYEQAPYAYGPPAVAYEPYPYYYGTAHRGNFQSQMNTAN